MKIRFIPFEKLPYADTCWSLIEGPDERAYVAACCERSSGGTVFVLRYDPRTEELEYLLDVAEAVGCPPDDGRGALDSTGAVPNHPRRATQCKIHYSMVIGDDGVMYGATHLSGPAVGEVSYNPWATFDDPLRSFVGARLFAYDTRTEKVLWTDTLIPHEGCRCVALDQERRSLYAVGYPRDHFYVYDLGARTRRDVGRIGSVNPQAVWLDSRNRAYTTDDYGRVVVYDPEREELTTTDAKAPHAPYQDGWHNMVYDVVQVPGSDDVVGVNWNVDPYLFRLSPSTGTMTDLGPATPGIGGSGVRGVNTNHAGGLVFTAGGELLFAVSRGDDYGDILPHAPAALNVMNLETRRVREVCELVDEQGVVIPYISRAVRIGREHLVLGTVSRTMAGIAHVVLDGELAEGPWQGTPRRYWG
jgi:hypothetical protein